MGSLLDEKTTWEEFGGALRDQGCQSGELKSGPVAARGKQHLDRRLTKDAKRLLEFS